MEEMFDPFFQFHLIALVGIAQQLVDAGFDGFPESAIVGLGQTGTFAFNNDEGNPIDKQDHVGDHEAYPADIIDAELVDGKERVVALIDGIKIDKPDRHIAGVGTITAVCPWHGDTLNEFFSQLTVSIKTAALIGSFQLADCPLNSDVIKNRLPDGPKNRLPDGPS